jgi:hypothetical protein
MLGCSPGVFGKTVRRVFDNSPNSSPNTPQKITMLKIDASLTERGGFEPPVRLPPHSISSAF